MALASHRLLAQRDFHSDVVKICSHYSANQKFSFHDLLLFEDTKLILKQGGPTSIKERTWSSPCQQVYVLQRKCVQQQRKSSTPHFYLENEKISKEEHQAEAQQQSAKKSSSTIQQSGVKTEKSETVLRLLLIFILKINLRTQIAQSSLSSKYLHKCKQAYFILQNQYL